MASKQAKKEMAQAREDFRAAKALIEANQPFPADLKTRLERTERLGWSVCHRDWAASLLYEECLAREDREANQAWVDQNVLAKE